MYTLPWDFLLEFEQIFLENYIEAKIGREGGRDLGGAKPRSQAGNNPSNFFYGTTLLIYWLIAKAFQNLTLFSNF